MPKMINLRVRGDQTEIETFVSAIQHTFHIVTISQSVAYGDNEFYERIIDVVRADTVQIDEETGEMKDLVYCVRCSHHEPDTETCYMCQHLICRDCGGFDESGKQYFCFACVDKHFS